MNKQMIRFRELKGPKSRFIGCMVGSAVGDALGASFEGLWINKLNIEEFSFHGRWTDDTHMMIGVAESIIANKGFNGKHMTQTFIKNWEKEPWRGYGPGPPRVFRMIKSGTEWNEAAKQLYSGMGSFGNGAAMRVTPIGLFYYDDAERLRETAYKSAEITHTHILGKEGAALQAYAVALAVKAEPQNLKSERFLEGLREFARLNAYKEKLEKAKFLLGVNDKMEIVKTLGNTVEALNSVVTSIYCFTKYHENYARAVLYAVSLGGDADTIGAMTGAIAGAYQGIENIPSTWIQRLERRDYIEKLAIELWKIKKTYNKTSR